MFKLNTHEIRADEADETDESRFPRAVIDAMTTWYHQKHGVHAMTTSNTGERTMKDAPNAGKSFFGGSEKPREKNFIFAVEADESDCPQHQNTLNGRNQAVEALAATQNHNFANNNNNNNNNYCHQLHTIHTTNVCKKNLCHRIDDSVFVKEVGI